MTEAGSVEDLLAEIRLLLQFPRHSRLAGLKLHRDAEPALHQAAERLYSKGLISQVDGGYLTDRGIEAANYAQLLTDALQPTMH
ncbi:MAG: TIGR02647 family protein [Permianibacter sp.]